jgi:hypothetical protein
MAADEEAVVAAPEGPAIAGVNGRMCVSVSVPVCAYTTPASRCHLELVT